IDAPCAVIELLAVSNDPCCIECFSDEDVASDDICTVVGCVSDEDIVTADACIVGYISDELSVIDDRLAWVPWSSDEDSVINVNCDVDDPGSGVERVCGNGCAEE
ncbi:hypothetical protein chiPu_0026416, partial [Chiloscyllium punctatum]|nr:hypothetical protein [Chiloscyllium punctatum]